MPSVTTPSPSRMCSSGECCQDSTAIALCKDNSTRSCFRSFGQGNIGRAVAGEPIGTSTLPPAAPASPIATSMDMDIERAMRTKVRWKPNPAQPSHNRTGRCQPFLLDQALGRVLHAPKPPLAFLLTLSNPRFQTIQITAFDSVRALIEKASHEVILGLHANTRRQRSDRNQHSALTEESPQRVLQTCLPSTPKRKGVCATIRREAIDQIKKQTKGQVTSPRIKPR